MAFFFFPLVILQQKMTGYHSDRPITEEQVLVVEEIFHAS